MFCHNLVAHSHTLSSADEAHWAKLPEIAASTFQNHELMSTHTWLNIFQSIDTSLSPVRTKFVSSLLSPVICFFMISISPQSFLARSESHAFKASARAHFSTHSCWRRAQRSIAILTDIGLLSRSISCCDCDRELLSTSTTTWAVIFFTDIVWIDYLTDSNAFRVAWARFLTSSLSMRAIWFSACHSLSVIFILNITPSWSHMNCSRV